MVVGGSIRGRTLVWVRCRSKAAVDCCAEVGWMGVVTEVMVVGGWDCVVAVVNLLGKTVTSRHRSRRLTLVMGE
jgi:hypothetical protein